MLYLPCPKCRGELQVRVAKRGSKAGSEFYGCDNFPQCKFTAEKTNIIDLVKKEIFKKQIPTQDSKYWTTEHLTKLSKKEIRFLASINDVSFNKYENVDDIVKKLLSLNNFDLFQLQNGKWCFMYNIASDFFSGFKFIHDLKSKFFNVSESKYKVVDNNGYVGGIFKATSTRVFLEFKDDYQIKYESGNSIVLILDQDSKSALAQVVNPQVINKENYSDFLLTIKN